MDFAPTLLTLIGIAVPTSMQGRVLSEAFTNGPAASALAVRTERHAATTADGSYSATATFSIVTTPGGTFRYFDSAKADRK